MGRRKEQRKEGMEERYEKTGEHVKGKGGKESLKGKSWASESERRGLLEKKERALGWRKEQERRCGRQRKTNAGITGYRGRNWEKGE